VSQSNCLEQNQEESKDVNNPAAVAVDDESNHSNETQNVQHQREDEVSCQELNVLFSCSSNSERGKDDGQNHEQYS